MLGPKFPVAAMLEGPCSHALTIFPSLPLVSSCDLQLQCSPLPPPFMAHNPKLVRDWLFLFKCWHEHKSWAKCGGMMQGLGHRTWLPVSSSQDPWKGVVVMRGCATGPSTTEY